MCVSRRIFLCTAVLILTGTALAKVFSAGGTAPILARQDPLFMLPMRHVMMGAALIELTAVAYLLVGIDRQAKQCLVLWLSASFILYRICIWRLSPGGPCPCLGSATASLGIKPAMADLILKLIVAYLFIGSALLVLCDLLKHESTRLGGAQNGLL